VCLATERREPTKEKKQHMSIRKKTMIVMSLVLVGLITALYLASHAILSRSFAMLETQDVRRNVTRARRAFDRELAILDAVASDWAAWDDTYAFVPTVAREPFSDASQAFIESNLVDGTFATLALNLIVFVDESGQVVYSKGFDLELEREVSLDPTLLAYLKDPALLQHDDPQGSVSGVLLLDGTPLLIVSRPIVTSKEEGPIRGTLIVGRYLTQSQIEHLAEVSNLALTVYAAQRAAELTEALVQSANVIVRPLDNDTVSGYGLIRDIDGDPALILQVDEPRDIYRQGWSTIRLYVASLLAVGLVFGGLSLWFLEKLILSRLTLLGGKVSEIGARHDLAGRIALEGHDEIAGLAETVDGMLDALQLVQHELQEREAHLRLVVQNMPAMMLALDEEGRIIIWNRECERVTGYAEDEVVGNIHALERMWPDEHYRNQMVREWFSRRYDYRDWEWQITCKDDSVRTISWSNISAHFPIPGWATWGIGIDVTDRRQAEDELKQRLEEQETLFAIGQLMTSNLQIDKETQLVAEHMAHLVDGMACTIYNWDAETERMTVAVKYVRPSQTRIDPEQREVGQSFAIDVYSQMAAALRERQPYLAVAGQEGEHNRYHVATVPFIARDRPIGLAQVYRPLGMDSWNAHDVRLLQTLAGPVAVALDNARLFSVIQANEAALRSLSLRLINVQELERRHIAQELHDELGQLLTAIQINVDLARRRLKEESPLRKRLDEASTLTHDVLANVRTLTVELRPTLLDDMGIVPTLRWYLRQFSQRVGVQDQVPGSGGSRADLPGPRKPEFDVSWDVPELPDRLQPEIETTIYRVVQEALTNVMRHAEADHVAVSLAHVTEMEDGQGQIRLSIQDDGRGFDLAALAERRGKEQTLGLTGMQERVMLLGGQVQIISQPGQGTRIEVVLPAHFRLE
jgi:PAS domain S-box-containing protein